MQDWNDFRLVLALTRGGSLPKAAAELGINASTAYRRLNALEERLGVRLFDRHAAGYVATATGERMALAAERVEAEAMALDREIGGLDGSLSGRLSVTASETFAFGLLTTLLAEFRARHPGILIELTTDNREFDLSRREADIAIRALRPRQGDLFGRKLAEIGWSLFAGPVYLEREGAPRDLADLARHQLIGWAAGAPTKAAEWLSAAAPADRVVYASNSLLNQMSAAKAGIGLVVLPCYLGDAEPGLRRVLTGAPGFTTELWLVTHADLRHAARVRAFFDEVGASIARHRVQLEGRGSPEEGALR